jgi:hypothetical protein
LLKVHLDDLIPWNYYKNIYLVVARKIFPNLKEPNLWTFSRHNYLVGAGKVFLTWKSSPSGIILGTITWWELERCSLTYRAHPLELF